MHSAEGPNLFGLYKWGVRVRGRKLQNDQPYTSKYEGSIIMGYYYYYYYYYCGFIPSGSVLRGVCGK